MAKRVPTQIVVAAFTNEEAADAAEKAITSAEWDAKQIVCKNMAIAKKDVAGKVSAKELGHPTSLESAVAGGSVGAIVGGLGLLLLGPMGVATGATAGAGTGAAISAYSASKIEGMDKDKLKKIGNALEPGCSAIVLVFDEVVVVKSDYESSLAEYKESTDALMEMMAAKIAENLKAGNEIAYHLGIDEDGIVASRTVVGKDAKNVVEMVLTPESMTATETNTTDTSIRVAETAVTPETIATARARLTSSICEYEFAALTDDDAAYEAGVIAAKK